MLERIAALWPTCIGSLPPQPVEDVITINMVALLCKDVIVRQLCHWIEYQFEPFGLGTDGILYSKGKIDMAAILDQDRENYLAYECKRLNVIQSGGRQSLATPYVTQGVMRFVTEQYAEGLPFGCMLGYVMDGDLPFAQQQVEAAINSHALVSLVDGPAALPNQSGVTRFRTSHNRNTGAVIELRHSFLA